MAVLHGNLKKLAGLAALLLVCLLAVGWGYTQVRAAADDRAEYRIVNDEYSQVLAPADPAAGLDQTLQLKAGEPLYGVRLLFATYERVAQGQLTAQLLDGAGQPVATAACNLTELLDNTFYGLVFDRPYTAPADGAYTLHLSFAPLTEEDRVGLHCSQGAVEGFALAQADGQALDATAALQYMTDYTGRWPSRGFLLIGLLYTVGVVGAAALLWWGRTPHLRAAFCLAGAALGVAFALATPPLGGPDEYVHFAGSYAAASRLMGQPDYDDEGGLWVRDCDEPYVTAETGPADAFVYHRVFSTLTEHGCARDLLHAVEVRSPGSMVQLLYLPQTLGVLLARLLGLGFTGLILAGRLCNLAVYLAPPLPWAALGGAGAFCWRWGCCPAACSRLPAFRRMRWCWGWPSPSPLTAWAWCGPMARCARRKPCRCWCWRRPLARPRPCMCFWWGWCCWYPPGALPGCPAGPSRA